jgi:hypothetical protein
LSIFALVKALMRGFSARAILGRTVISAVMVWLGLV